ncbi:MAG: hypothetical protein PHR92_14480 [Lachnospiraceae bacterium]|nr:hypothetical protein [Lachnospiraceae bacterium]
MFRIVVPLDDRYSFDMEIGSETTSETNATNHETNHATNATNHETDATDYSISLTENEQSVLNMIRSNPKITQNKILFSTQKAACISTNGFYEIIIRLRFC